MHTEKTDGQNLIQAQVVTYNSRETIGACIDSLLRQTTSLDQIVVIDNASQDGCVELIKLRYPQVRVVSNVINAGYAGGHNLGFRMAFVTGMNYVLTVNPDVELSPDYVTGVLRGFNTQQGVGGMTGKLFRHECNYLGHRIIDSTGLTMGLFLHVRDRDFGQPDLGQREIEGAVWGVCGAAAMYRVSMLRDLEEDGKVFDEAFFLYKEDVDLCWRAQRRNWSFGYMPQAIGLHKRSWVKGSKMSSTVVAHSFSNQIALLVKHVPSSFLPLFVAILVELIRYALLLCRRPLVAFRIIATLRRNWIHHWRQRKRLRARDLVRKEILYDLGCPGYL